MFVTLFLLFVTLVLPLLQPQMSQQAAPPVAADEVVFQPSGKVYPAGTPWRGEDLPKLYPNVAKRFR